MTVPTRRVDFVPPSQPHQSASGDVFQVVEVGGEEEHRYYEDEDAVWGVFSFAVGGKMGEGKGTNKLSVRKYIPKM